MKNRTQAEKQEDGGSRRERKVRKDKRRPEKEKGRKKEKRKKDEMR